jgi:hypothetical protein
MSKARELAELSRTVADSADAVAITVDSNENTTFTGVVTANAGVVVDNITIDGTTLALSSGDLTLDVAGDIVLDADGGDIQLKDGGVPTGRLGLENGDLNIASMRQDYDIRFKGMDGNTTPFTALTLDMSEAGAATFNSSVSTGGDIILPSAGKLYSSGDTDSFLQFNQPNTLRAIIGDSTRMIIEPNTTVFNEDSADLDFRVESSGNANMLFVDGGNNRVGVGTGSPSVRLEVGDGVSSETIKVNAGSGWADLILNSGSSNGGSIYWNDGADAGQLFYYHFDDSMRFHTATTERLRIASGGGITTYPAAGGHAVFNENGVDADFRVESNNNANMLFVDASANAIGINQSSPAYALDVLGGTRTTIQTMGVLTNMPNSNWIEVGRWYISNAAQSSRIKITFLGAQGYGENEMGETTFIGTIDNTSDLSGYAWSNAFFTAVSKVAWKYDTDHFKFYVANAQFGAAAPVVYATAGYFEGVANDTGSTSLPAGATEAFYRWQLRLNGSTTSVTSISAYETNLVINEDGIDYDFRVESNNNANMLFVDGGEDIVSMGMPVGVPSWIGGNSVVVADNIYAFQGASYSNACFNLSVDDNYTYLLHNAYYGAGWEQRLTGYAPTMLQTGSAAFNFNYAVDTGSDVSISWISLMALNSSGAIFNNGGNAGQDFRVKSSGNANMLFVDGGANHVNIGTSTDHGGTLNVNDSIYVAETDTPRIRLRNIGNSDTELGVNGLGAGLDTFYIAQYAGIAANEWDFRLTGASREFAFIRGGVVNEGAGDSDFRVESSGNANMLFVDASANTVFIGGTTTGQNVIHLDAGRIVLDKTNDWNIESGNSSNGLHFRVRHSNADVGSIQSTASGTTYATTSDRRLKKDIKTITDGTDKLMAMNPVTHGWKADPEADTVHGFIAQEMMDIVPEAVSGDPEGEEMMSMDYGRITPVLVAALQDAHKKIAELETRLNELEGK